MNSLVMKILSWIKMETMKKFIPYITLATLIGAGVLAYNMFNVASRPTPIVQIATDTPTTASSSGPCAYTWAYHNAEELSGTIDAKIRNLNPAASGNANFFGEDCVYADGHSTFGVMETDFYIHKPVDNLTNEEAFGNWMAQAMKIVIEIPREQIQGNYGFVEFWFEKSEGEHVIVRVPIQQYKDAAQTKTGVELFRMFATSP
jgi:hypothetical protein